MNAGLVILTAKDAADCAALHAAGFSKGWSSAEFSALLQQPAILGLGLTCAADALKGFVLVQKVGDMAEILTITVTPDARNQGFAKQLLNAMEKRLGARGMARVVLDVAEDNSAAIKLYESVGFIVDGRRPGYYQTGREMPADAILMSKSLSL